MWKVEYTKKFLKELANLPQDMQARIEPRTYYCLVLNAKVLTLNENILTSNQNVFTSTQNILT